jgi:hypothetical protein
MLDTNRPHVRLAVSRLALIRQAAFSSRPVAVVTEALGTFFSV